jgi:hypothetical protein
MTIDAGSSSSQQQHSSSSAAQQQQQLGCGLVAVFERERA